MLFFCFFLTVLQTPKTKAQKQKKNGLIFDYEEILTWLTHLCHFRLRLTLVLGSKMVTASAEIVSSTLGGFCPSALLMCLLN